MQNSCWWLSYNLTNTQPWNWTDLLLERISFVLLFFQEFETNTYILHKPLSLMLQVKLWNKQIPSYTHTDTNQTHKQVLLTSSHPLSLPQCLWENMFERFLLCIWLVLSLQLTNSLGLCVYQCSAYTSTHSAGTNAPAHARLCLCSVWQWAERGGPSGHPCHAMFPVKCCQHGLCGLLWRLKACSTALPARAANLRKGNLGRSNAGVAPELFTEPSTGPAPPTIFHMRTRACGACSAVCAWVGGDGGVSMGVGENMSTFTRKCRLLMYVCRCVRCILTLN